MKKRKRGGRDEEEEEEEEMRKRRRGRRGRDEEEEQRKKRKKRGRRGREEEEEDEGSVSRDVCSHLLLQTVNQLLQPVDLHHPLAVLVVNPCWTQRELQQRLGETETREKNCCIVRDAASCTVEALRSHF